MSGLKGFPPHSEVERAYVRGLKEGKRRAAAILAEKRELREHWDEQTENRKRYEAVMEAAQAVMAHEVAFSRVADTSAMERLGAALAALERR